MGSNDSCKFATYRINAALFETEENCILIAYLLNYNSSFDFSPEVILPEVIEVWNGVEFQFGFESRASLSNLSLLAARPLLIPALGLFLIKL